MNQANRASSFEHQAYPGEVWNGGLSLIDVVKGMWVYRWSSSAIVAACTVAAILIAALSTPIYRAEVLLSPLADEGSGSSGLGGIMRQLGDVGPLMGMAGIGSVGLKTETLALVRSRSFLIGFIQHEKLMPLMYPEFAANSSSSELPTYADAYRWFDSSILQVQEDKDTGLVQLSIEWPDPQLAARWANKLVDRINEHMRARSISEAQRSIEYLQQELTKTSVLGVQDSIYRLIETHISQIALANSRDGYALRVIDNAVAPEKNEFVKPRRLLLVALGVVGGSLAALLIVVLRLIWQRSE